MAFRQREGRGWTNRDQNYFLSINAINCFKVRQQKKKEEEKEEPSSFFQRRRVGCLQIYIQFYFAL